MNVLNFYGKKWEHLCSYFLHFSGDLLWPWPWPYMLSEGWIFKKNNNPGNCKECGKILASKTKF